MARNGKMIELVGDEGFALGAYLVSPADVGAESNRQGLVLVQEIFGVTDHIQELCDGYAERGFTVIAPSMYDRGEKGWQSDYTGEDFNAPSSWRRISEGPMPKPTFKPPSTF